MSGLKLCLGLFSFQQPNSKGTKSPFVVSSPLVSSSSSSSNIQFPPQIELTGFGSGRLGFEGKSFGNQVWVELVQLGWVGFEIGFGWWD